MTFQIILPGDDPPEPSDPTHEPVEWTKIDEYPDSGTRIRGASVYRTIHPAPLAYRVVLEAATTRPLVYRIPLPLYRHPFPTPHVQYGFLLPWEKKVLGWHDELPPATRVLNGSPDFVEHPLS